MHHDFGWDFNGIIGKRVIKFWEFANPNFEYARFDPFLNFRAVLGLKRNADVGIGFMKSPMMRGITPNDIEC